METKCKANKVKRTKNAKAKWNIFQYATIIKHCVYLYI